MLPADESVSMIEPCRGPPAASDTPADRPSNQFEVTKTAQRARVSCTYYDLGTGVSKLKYECAVS